MTDRPPPLTLEGVTFSYGMAPVLESLDLSLQRGQLAFVIGRNGSGKSTLLGLAAGLLAPITGRVALEGRDLSGLARRDIARQLAIVPQGATADLPFSALEVTLQGRHPYLGPFAVASSEDIDLARGALEELGISELADRTVTELSGGELAMVQMAAALAQTPDVLLVDEPAASLDPAHVQALFGALQRRAAAGAAVLVTSHDLNHAALFGERIIALASRGVVATGPPVDVLTTVTLEAIYGVQLHVGASPASGRPIVLLEP